MNSAVAPHATVAEAATVMRLETELAKGQMTRVERRDEVMAKLTERISAMTRAELIAKAFVSGDVIAAAHAGCFSMALSLNTATARAMAPTSSRAPRRWARGRRGRPAWQAVPDIPGQGRPGCRA